MPKAAGFHPVTVCSMKCRDQDPLFAPPRRSHRPAVAKADLGRCDRKESTVSCRLRTSTDSRPYLPWNSRLAVRHRAWKRRKPVHPAYKRSIHRPARFTEQPASEYRRSPPCPTGDHWNRPLVPGLGWQGLAAAGNIQRA